MPQISRSYPEDGCAGTGVFPERRGAGFEICALFQGRPTGGESPAMGANPLDIDLVGNRGDY